MDLHKFAPEKYVVKLRKLRRKFGAKMVNATFAWLFTPPVFWYANVVFTIFAHIYSSVFTFLRHICNEKICRQILFSRPAELFSIAIIRAYKFGSIGQSGGLFASSSV